MRTALQNHFGRLRRRSNYYVTYVGSDNQTRELVIKWPTTLLYSEAERMVRQTLNDETLVVLSITEDS